MSLLKRLPIQYRGELHDVRLINFSVAIEEVLQKVPANIKVKDFNGRAMVSMVDVKLKNMRPVPFPFVRFNYRHVPSGSWLTTVNTMAERIKGYSSSGRSPVTHSLPLAGKC